MQSLDRLSALPDPLLVHILSFLEIKDTPITALLSKRWRFLWTQSPRLAFKESTACRGRDFVARVHRTLIMCGGRKDLETFEVEFSYGEIFSSDVDVWVDFVVKNKFKQISLLLNPSSSPNDFYTLPRKIFHNSYLKRLTLRRCVVDSLRTIEWRSLTELTVEQVELKQHVVEEILSGCPVLCCLVLNYCWGFSRLEVEDAKSLYKLRVCDRDDDGVDDDVPSLQISAPYIHYLWISLYCKGIRKLCLGNISSLVRVTIDFTGTGWDADSVEVMDNAKEILEKIRHVKVFESRGRFSEVLSSMAMTGYQFPESARKCLLVNARAEMGSIHGIVGLLESSPNLEALVIQGFSFLGVEPGSGPDANGDLGRDLLHLRTITFENFVHQDLAGEPMLTLARILLNKTPVLEKIVCCFEGIRARPSVIPTLSDPCKIVQMLMSYPRSSRKAVLRMSC